MERTIELVGFDDHEVRIGQDVVGAVVLRDTAQEGIAVEMALVHDMSTHGAGSRLAMRTCHAESFMLTGQRAEHLGTFLDFETVLTEETQFLMIFRDSGRINNQT